MRLDGPIVVDDETTQNAEQYRRQKSTAVLTIMFTDIEDSTKIRESLGEIAYERAREEHESVISSVVHSGNAGAVVKGTGDGQLAVFAEPSVAVEKSLEIQAQLRGHEHFRLRIGLDMGQVSKETMGGIVTDVFGRHVNRAARITSVAEPQHVLTTHQVYDSAVGWLDSARIGWRPHGLYSLKGFSEQVSLHEPFDQRQSREAASLDYDAEATNGWIAPPSRRAPDATLSPDTTAPMTQVQGRTTLVPRLRHTAPAQDSATLEEQLHRLSSALSTRRLSPRSGGVLAKLFWTIGRKATPQNSILWVDDHPENNTALERLLQARGCEITVVRTTEEALRKLKTGGFRAVISDMGRSGNPRAGLELLEQIRERGLRVPSVVYTSVNAAAIYGADARQLGAIECTSGAITLVATLSGILSQ